MRTPGVSKGTPGVLPSDSGTSSPTAGRASAETGDGPAHRRSHPRSAWSYLPAIQPPYTGPDTGPARLRSGCGARLEGRSAWVSETRKIVAILVSDVVGDSRLASVDEDRRRPPCPSQARWPFSFRPPEPGRRAPGIGPNPTAIPIMPAPTVDWRARTSGDLERLRLGSRGRRRLPITQGVGDQPASPT